MFQFISLEEAKAHLRVDSTADDPWLVTWIPVVEAAVTHWLKGTDRAFYVFGPDGIVVDSNDEPILSDTANPAVKAAVLVELASQYRFRDGDGAALVPAHWGHGYTLGIGATSILTPLRKPTLA